jgi:hypothetical protein
VSLLCTIELGLRTLRVVEAIHRQPVRHAEMLLPEGCFNDGMPTRDFKQFLSRSLKDWGTGATVARVAISDAGVAVRDFRLPRLPRDELVSAVTFEARRLVPLDPADVHYAWHALRDDDGYAVYVVAARREMVEGLISAIAVAGLTAERIDLKALALARGANVADGLLLDWGLAEATMVLVAGGRPRFFRTFPLETPDADAEAQFDELLSSFNALIRFVRTTEPEGALSPATPLYLAGRLGPDALEKAAGRFDFTPRLPAITGSWPAEFPWQSHLAAIGLLQTERWHDRITPTEGGEHRAAA